MRERAVTVTLLVLALALIAPGSVSADYRDSTVFTWDGGVESLPTPGGDIPVCKFRDEFGLTQYLFSNGINDPAKNDCPAFGFSFARMQLNKGGPLIYDGESAEEISSDQIPILDKIGTKVIDQDLLYTFDLHMESSLSEVTKPSGNDVIIQDASMCADAVQMTFEKYTGLPSAPFSVGTLLEDTDSPAGLSFILDYGHTNDCRNILDSHGLRLQGWKNNFFDSGVQYELPMYCSRINFRVVDSVHGDWNNLRTLSFEPGEYNQPILSDSDSTNEGKNHFAAEVTFSDTSENAVVKKFRVEMFDKSNDIGSVRYQVTCENAQAAYEMPSYCENQGGDYDEVYGCCSADYVSENPDPTVSCVSTNSQYTWELTPEPSLCQSETDVGVFSSDTQWLCYESGEDTYSWRASDCAQNRSGCKATNYSGYYEEPVNQWTLEPQQTCDGSEAINGECCAQGKYLFGENANGELRFCMNSEKIQKDWDVYSQPFSAIFLRLTGGNS